jgi:predicted fused transcriptional regulator/phosphomethylpyrimidine kinase/predicted transcriptional regulator
MHPPSEIMVKHLLPALRGLVTHNLDQKGYSQSRIASLLGVTQASVSLYLTRKPSAYLEKTRELGVPNADTERYVEMLSEDVIRNHVEAIYTLSSLWRNLLATGALCTIHRQESVIVEECDVCMQLYSPVQTDVTKTQVLREVERTAKMVEDSPFFPLVMPEVSVNIVMATPKASTEMDVAALPGRMVKIHGRAGHMLPAEFGVSRHMARMLLTAMRNNPAIRAALNIRYDRRVDRILLQDLQLKVIRIVREDHQSSLEGDAVVSAFKAKLNDSNAESVQVIVDEGGEGLEPNTYIFAGDATEAAQIALEIAKHYMEK